MERLTIKYKMLAWSDPQRTLASNANLQPDVHRLRGGNLVI